MLSFSAGHISRIIQELRCEANEKEITGVRTKQNLFIMGTNLGLRIERWITCSRRTTKKNVSCLEPIIKYVLPLLLFFLTETVF